MLSGTGPVTAKLCLQIARNEQNGAWLAAAGAPFSWDLLRVVSDPSLCSQAGNFHV